MYKILIVEDYPIIANTLASHMQSWDYEARCPEDFKRIIELFAEFSPHLVLLDITLPFFDGYHWCQEIRKLSKVPIIFISSASDNMNIVMAMNMGADDFIAKPFDLNVLTAKVHALLRRTYDFSEQTNLIHHAGAVLNLSDASLTYNGARSELTKNEFKILQVLLENKGKIVSRDAIITHLWETDSYIDDNTLTVNMTRLRKKLTEIGLAEFITTKKGIGYLIEQ